LVQSQFIHRNVHRQNPVRKRLESLKTLLFPDIKSQGLEGHSRYIPSRKVDDGVFIGRNLEMVEQML
jgi:hypothetical protein